MAVNQEPSEEIQQTARQIGHKTHGELISRSGDPSLVHAGLPRLGSQGIKRAELLPLLQREIRKARGVENYNPLVAIAMIATDPRNSPELQSRCHAEIAQYLFPKLKSVEVKHSDVNGDDIKTSLVTNLLALVEKLAKRGDDATVIEGKVDAA